MNYSTNKYSDLYFRIIETAPQSEYMETHHIVPRSLGGSDDQSNLVTLSARAHFICHYLLTKMFPHGSVEWKKMIMAFNMMAVSNETMSRQINNRLYESNRKNFSIAMSISQSGEGNSQFGTKWLYLGETSIKVPEEDVEHYIERGYQHGRSAPKTKIKKSAEQLKEERQTKRKMQIIDQVKPFFERYLSGESLRELAPEYGSSHVTLQKDIVLCFGDQLDSIKHGSKNRKSSASGNRTQLATD